MRLVVAAVSFFLLAQGTSAAPPPITPQPFVSGLSAPVEIAHANDSSGRLFVVEQGGRIRVIRNGLLLSTPFLDLSAANGGPVRTGGEQGLLGLAFHPAYASNGRFYVFYTRALGSDPGNEIVIQRFNRSPSNPDLADASSGSIVLTIAHPQFTNHNGGKLAFGPDGYLYIGVGDGGGGGDPFNAAQSLGDLRGKILRIDVDGGAPYAIPPTNPFGNEIWAYGLRNPWRFSFDRLTGDLFIGDVGQGAWEEIDFEPRGSGGGRNYGWRIFEGTHCFNPPSGCSLAGHVPPIIEYGHDSSGGFSVTGGYRYRGGALPALSGFYLYGDFVSDRVWAAEPSGSGGGWVTTEVATVPNISTFGEDENGELYAANLGAGTIVRLTPAATTIPRLINLSTRGRVLTGEDVLIGGFVIGGPGSKRVIVRARGPSLTAHGISDALANPVLQIVRSSDQATIAVNDDWGGSPDHGAIAASGFVPPEPHESAVLATLAPGAYTAIVSGVGGGTGVGLVEIFELDHPEVPLINVSTRGRVQTGENVLIGGFIIQGNGPQTVVVRARGPSMSAQGVSDVLLDPVINLYSGQTLIASNDNWQAASNASTIQSSGFAPADSREAAIHITLNPGAYTAIVSGAGGSTGVGIVEVFRIP